MRLPSKCQPRLAIRNRDVDHGVLGQHGAIRRRQARLQSDRVVATALEPRHAQLLPVRLEVEVASRRYGHERFLGVRVAARQRRGELQAGGRHRAIGLNRDVEIVHGPGGSEARHQGQDGGAQHSCTGPANHVGASRWRCPEPSLRTGPCHDIKMRPARSAIGAHAAALPRPQVAAAGHDLAQEIAARKSHQQPKPEFHDATPGCWPGISLDRSYVTRAGVRLRGNRVKAPHLPHPEQVAARDRVEGRTAWVRGPQDTGAAPFSEASVRASRRRLRRLLSMRDL